MPAPIRIETPQELLSAVPHLIGFQPHDSIVMLGLANQPMIVRIDTPTVTHAAKAAHALSGAFERNNFSEVLVVGYTDDDDAFTAFIDALTVNLRSHLRVRGQHFFLDGDPTPLPLATCDRVSAEMVFRGSAPAPSRDALVTRIAPVDTIDDELDHALKRRDTEKCPKFWEDEAEWLLANLTGWTTNGIERHDMARFVAAMESGTARDVVATRMNTFNACPHRDLLTEIVRHCRRGPHLAQTLGLLALANWLCGDGASAWVAVDAGSECGGSVLIDLVRTTLVNAVPPTMWNDMTLT